MSLWLLRNTRDGRVIRDVNLTDGLFNLLGQFCLDLLLVPLMLLIDLLEIVFIVLMLTFSGTLSSAHSLPLLRSLLLCEVALCESRTSLFYLLLLCLLVAMSMG